MILQFEVGWKNILNTELSKPYFTQLTDFVHSEYNEYTCFPSENDIFAAFDYCKFDDLKVVILGQDPYHGINQAHGLCFSVLDGTARPPSLINIYKELEKDLGIPIRSNGDLSIWAKQGVLLLNATLSVRAHQAGSHQKKGGETFTDAVIRQISEEKVGVVFLLWGNFARSKKKLIDQSKHRIFETGHPSPRSANRGLWFGNKHFSKTNIYLKSIGKEPIMW